ncbi:hypothetical protein KR093_002540 [Drosophila rubida]|uniref:Telomere-binding protein cav n=1 Tax=Drosophila rubida TaxID=30044 RepID=A0AAD4JUA4_9MUSC|nr:hypothetical protein KR093_002540 [Drosophila rubida]
MSRCLSQALVQYQNDFDADIRNIADGLEEPEKSYVQGLSSLQKVTSEDLSRTYSASDVRQLCLRTKVRVNMTLFNCLWDAKKRFDKKGRLQNRSERFINAMYVKAVKNKMVFPYESEEIARCLHIRRCQLKRRNNFRLDRWRLPWQSPDVLEQSSGLDDESSLMLAQIPNRLPNSPANGKAATDIQLVYPASIESEIDIQLEHPAAKEPETSTSQQISEPELWPFKSTNAESEDKQLSKNNESEDLTLSKMLANKSLPDWVDAAVAINSESMTIDIETQSESEPLADDYLEFNTQVPCTSTQSQHSTEDFL